MAVRLQVLDTRQRPLRDLRISVTDRCNFRCTYCMPRDVYSADFAFLPKSQILSFEEIQRVAAVGVSLGVTKLRLTGGEPLLRSELPVLISMLKPLGAELALTTNGSLLTKHASSLKAAGLDRISVSLDALDNATFARMTDSQFPVQSVLDGILAAQQAGLRVKVNCVVRRGVNDHAILDLAQHFRDSGVILRFIEFMDVGITNGWNLTQVVPAHEILSIVSQRHTLTPLPRHHDSEVSERFSYSDGAGEIGVIASVSQPFCNNCTRLRLSADGQLFTCLFAATGSSVRSLLRDGSSEEDLRAHMRSLWEQRSDAYSERRNARTRGLPRVEMSFIGG